MSFSSFSSFSVRTGIAFPRYSTLAGLTIRGSLNGSINSATGLVNIDATRGILADIHAATGIYAHTGETLALSTPVPGNITGNLVTTAGDINLTSDGPADKNAGAITGTLATGLGNIQVLSHGGSISGTITSSQGTISSIHAIGNITAAITEQSTETNV